MPFFNNISAISWWSVLFVEETGGPGENHRPVASHWQTVVHFALIEIRTHNINTDCRVSCKSNYHTFTARTAPQMVTIKQGVLHTLTYTSKLTVRIGSAPKFTTKEIISIFPLWTFHSYVATLHQYLHMEYKYLSWYNIPELVVPIMIFLIEVCS